MKNKINKYLLLFIILSVASYILPMVKELVISTIYGENVPIIARANWQMLYTVTIFLPHIAAALWLRHLAKKKESGTLLWFFFGLVGGLISVGIFYLIGINEKLETQQANQPDAE